MNNNSILKSLKLKIKEKNPEKCGVQVNLAIKWLQAAVDTASLMR